MLPVTLYVYFKYGRGSKPIPKSKESHDEPSKAEHCHASSQTTAGDKQDIGSESTSRSASEHSDPTSQHFHSQHHAADSTASPTATESKDGRPHSSKDISDSNAEKGQAADASANAEMAHCCHHDSSSPMWATILVGVSHCGAGCVIGDLVGEWLVYGTGAKIDGESIWGELPVDYAFALLFGIAFRYFSIAPMSGEYGLKSVWRAAKADILSLTRFEVGAFAWMIIY